MSGGGITAMWACAAVIRIGSEDQRQEAIEQAAHALAKHPLGEDFLALIEPARAGDPDARRELAESLVVVADLESQHAQRAAEQRAREKAARDARRAALDFIKQAARAGVTVARVEVDGVTLVLGEPTVGENRRNELDQWLAKHAN